MITLQNNPGIIHPSNSYGIYMAMTRDTLIDTDIYSRYIHSIENNFRASKFYKSFKAELYNLGLDRDQNMANISSEMVPLEIHHNMLELKMATIMIIEHILNMKGCVTTFEVIKELEECHRSHMFALIMLTTTNHQAYHADPTAFISLKQCIGDPFSFIEKYADGMTLDIAYKLLLHFKQEEQYGESYHPKMVKARDQILSWMNYSSGAA